MITQEFPGPRLVLFVAEFDCIGAGLGRFCGRREDGCIDVRGDSEAEGTFARVMLRGFSWANNRQSVYFGSTHWINDTTYINDVDDSFGFLSFAAAMSCNIDVSFENKDITFRETLLFKTVL